MFEIERKFHLRSLPRGVCDSALVVQGYITNGVYSVRLRRVDSSVKGDKDGEIRFYLTYKSGEGLIREETEEEIDCKLFKILWPLTGELQVHKIRYRFGDWEIDEYLRCGKVLEPCLITAEIELDTEEQEIVIPAEIEEVLVKEVTDNPLFSNMVLAQNTEQDGHFFKCLNNL